MALEPWFAYRARGAGELDETGAAQDSVGEGEDFGGLVDVFSPRYGWCNVPGGSGELRNEPGSSTRRNLARWACSSLIAA